MKKGLFFFLGLISLLFSNFEINAQDNFVGDLILEQKYEQAIELIVKNKDIDKMTMSELENLGYCYVMTKDFSNAEMVYEELTTRPKSKDENVLFYAKSLFLNGKYQAAKENFEKYALLNPKYKSSTVKIASCDSMILWQNIESENKVQNYSVINTEADETSSFLMDGRVYFLTNEQQNKIENDSSKTTIYKKWMAEKYWCSSYTYCQNNNTLAYSLRKINKTDILEFDSSVVMYDTPENTSFDNLTLFEWDGMTNEYNVAHPFFANNGNRMFFSSDMPDGFGGMDIYYSDLVNEKWSVPVNLGENVNTEFDDLCPSVFGDTLYFSSNGLPSYGNFDVFYSLYVDDNFSKPINLKAPVNSIGNDLFFKRYTENQAFVSSDRPGGKGGMDIYEITIPIEEDQVEIEEEYVFESYSLPYILFDYNSSSVWAGYSSVLKNIADTLKTYDYVSLEILGNTDITGKLEYNEKLSTNRANSVAKAIIDLGVSESKISVKGLGESDDKSIDNIKYHVFIGTAPTNDKAEWFSKLLNGKMQVSVMPYGEIYCYYVETYNSLKDAENALVKLKKDFNVDFYTGASYNGQFIPNYTLAINRRVQITYVTEK